MSYDEESSLPVDEENVEEIMDPLEESNEFDSGYEEEDPDKDH